MKKLVAIALLIITLLFAEYHVIMHSLKPYHADGYIYIEAFNQTYTYDGELN